MEWLQATDPRLQVAGLPWLQENEGRFMRLPARARELVRPDIWWLAQMPSGGQIKFRSDTTALTVRVAHSTRPQMSNMAPMGHSGIDLYVGEPGRQLYWATTTPNAAELEYQSALFAGADPAMREFTLYLPVYNDLIKLEIGLSDGATVLPATPFALPKPVVFYGSSITQSGCSTRPGNGYVPWLGRMLNVEVVNQGYSGNGLGEPEMATLLSELDASCFVLDFHCNVQTVEGLREVHLPFYRKLRAAHPEMPVLMLSMIGLPQELYRKAARDKRLGQTQVVRETFEAAIQSGDPKVRFFDGSWLLQPETDGAWVDGIHPNDLGFARMAEGLAPVLRSILFEN